jgi:proton glutamate symport protein
MKRFGLVGIIICAAGLVLSLYAVKFTLPATLLRLLGLLLLIVYAVHRKSLTFWILISMLIGIEVGIDFPAFSQQLKVFSQIFLKAVKMIIAPLLFATLVYGIAGHSNLKQVGRMGWKSLLYFEIVTTLALFIGLGAIQFTGAGKGIMPPAVSVEQPVMPDKKPKNVSEIILDAFPENIAKSVYENAVLQVVVFSVLFGIGLSLTEERFKTPMLSFVESLSEVMFQFTTVIMYMAPIGVGCAMAVTIGHMGLGILKNLFMLLLTLYGALAVFVLAILFPVALLFRVPVRRFIQSIIEPVSIAFATTSSDAALPKAIAAMEKLGVPRKIVTFVIPMGYSFNLDGTTLYLSLATVFVAQAAGIDLSLTQQLTILFTLMLTSKGVAGVPRASLVILIGTAASFNLPMWPIYLILGIDELMDMARTSVNVIGNCLATVVIARWEGEFNEIRQSEYPDIG